MIDFELTDEQRLVRETAREFADREIVPRVRDNDRNERFDTELVQKIADMGFLGAIVPEEYGGRGVDYRTYGLIVEEIGRGDSAMRTVVSVVTSLVCSSIARWGSEEQKREWLPRLCSGEALGCFGLTEPDTGSDAANLKTRAEKVNGSWRITGGKMWISLGNYAKLALVFAQTEPEKKHKGLACFLVPTNQPGFTTQEIHGKLGLRGSDTAELSLDGVEGELMGEVGEGFKIAMTALDSGRYSVAAGCVGICQGCVDASVAYAKETSIAKLYATEAAVKCANTAIQVHGGSGYVDDYPVERYLRDARVTTLYEGTSQIQKLIIARAITGVNALA
jgi:butyryl-CoA dehydrogenase